MDLPTDNDQYAMKDYWDERYTDEVNYDWFARYKSFSHHIVRTINRWDRILQLGCGNSSLAVDLYNDGFKNIVNMDYSSVVISNMQRRYKALKGIEWVIMDMMDMTEFLPSSFDVVLEKGTLDALLVAEKDPWKLSSDAEDLIDIILQQISRLLKPNGGRFISITFAQPHFRVPLYVANPAYDWNVTTETFGTGFHYFYYTMTRGCQPSGDIIELRKKYEQRKTVSHKMTPISDSEDEDFLLGAVNVDVS